MRSFKVKYCLKASGHGAPATLSKFSLAITSALVCAHGALKMLDDLLSDWSAGFRVDLVLDRLKQKEATKRVLFLHGRISQYSKNMLVNNGKAPACEEQDVFLRVRRSTENSYTCFTIRADLSFSVRTTASFGIRSLLSPW